jgi:crotonobetainyl-CoA:carnitine CoA-transferase CaiB-like acyl-CoA transferase
MARLPLEGIRVLDLTRAYAGPTATLYLADLGAEVIKIEAATRPDIPTREINFAENEPGEEPWERAAYFHRLNTGKLDITLDLTNEKGRDLFRRLVPHADVVAENYNPATMERFGLDYPALKEINHRIIMVSMSGFGSTGPRRSWAAYYTAMESMSGLVAMTGYADGETMYSGTGYADWILGSAGAAAVLIALHHRNRTGLGQYIDVSGREALLVHIGEAIADFSMNGRAAAPVGNRHPSWAPHDTYRAAGDDRWVAIAVRDEDDWAAFCRALGNPSWVLDPRFADPVSRWRHQDEMRPLIEAWTAARDHRDAALALLSIGVPAAPVLDPREVFFDPQLREREYFEAIEHPVVGRRLYPRQIPARYSAVAREPRAHPPLLGEHNREVLGRLLGIDDEELSQLESEGVIGTKPLRARSGGPRPHPFDAWRRSGGKIDDDYRAALGAEYGQPIGPA